MSHKQNDIFNEAVREQRDELKNPADYLYEILATSTMNDKTIHGCQHCGNAWSNLAHKDMDCGGEDCANCSGRLCPKCEGWKNEICNDCNVKHEIPGIVLELRKEEERDAETREHPDRHFPYDRKINF